MIRATALYPAHAIFRKARSTIRAGASSPASRNSEIYGRRLASPRAVSRLPTATRGIGPRSAGSHRVSCWVTKRPACTTAPWPIGRNARSFRLLTRSSRGLWAWRLTHSRCRALPLPGQGEHPARRMAGRMGHSFRVSEGNVVVEVFHRGRLFGARAGGAGIFGATAVEVLGR